MFSSQIRTAIAGLASISLIAALVPSLASASAAPEGASARTAIALASQDGTCDVGEVCLYHNAGFNGSLFDTAHNDQSLFNNHFITAGSGQGHVVANDAEAVWNRDPNTRLMLCTGVNQTGSCMHVGAGQSVNLSAPYTNSIESIIWLDPGN